MNLWPTFHNGVAAGLRLTPYTKDIDSDWILFNKPKVNFHIYLFFLCYYIYLYNFSLYILIIISDLSTNRCAYRSCWIYYGFRIKWPFKQFGNA